MSVPFSKNWSSDTSSKESHITDDDNHKFQQIFPAVHHSNHYIQDVPV